MIRFSTWLMMTIFLLACNTKQIPDISHIQADVKIHRTEEALSIIKTVGDLDHLIQTHPAFYNLYFDEILGISGADTLKSRYEACQSFMQDSMMADVLLRIDKTFTGDKLKESLRAFYRYAIYYFPDFKVPDVYTFVSAFGYQAFIFQDDDGRDGIALGLDMFLYPQIDYKALDPNNTNFSDYITRSWNQEHIARKVAEIHTTEWLGPPPGQRLIDHMIHNGKALYITGLLLPEVHDTILAEYSQKQLQWCLDNELEMWSFFMNEKMFFETNPAKINKYILPSPNSPQMPDAAPGRTANYLGWKIIQAYMQRFPETTLQQLISLRDSQSILEKSKYKPKPR
jgi:hypothetical protein